MAPTRGAHVPFAPAWARHPTEYTNGPLGKMEITPEVWLYPRNKWLLCVMNMQGTSITLYCTISFVNK